MTVIRHSPVSRAFWRLSALSKRAATVFDRELAVPEASRRMGRLRSRGGWLEPGGSNGAIWRKNEARSIALLSDLRWITPGLCRHHPPYGTAPFVDRMFHRIAA